jgi:hypothetical protein
MSKYAKRVRPPEEIRNLPKTAVIRDLEGCATYLGEGTLATLLRLEKKGDAPPRTQISERLYGRTVGAWEQWIASRTAAPSS